MRRSARVGCARGRPPDSLRTAQKLNTPSCSRKVHGRPVRRPPVDPAARHTNTHDPAPPLLGTAPALVRPVAMDMSEEELRQAARARLNRGELPRLSPERI